MSLYKSMVDPHLEYNVQLGSLHLKMIHKKDMVQKREPR